MTYQTLSLHCHCGRPSSNIREVGFTSDHQLVLHWRCPECKSYVYGLKPLKECWQVCPPEDAPEDTGRELSAAAVQEMDTKFLQELGVRFPEDGDS